MPRKESGVQNNHGMNSIWSKIVCYRMPFYEVICKVQYKRPTNCKHLNPIIKEI